MPEAKCMPTVVESVGDLLRQLRVRVGELGYSGDLPRRTAAPTENANLLPVSLQVLNV